MLLRTKRALAALTAAGAIGVAVVPVATAQQSGLVNVEISNVLNNNTVQVTVPVNVAANVCGVSVDVLTQELQNGSVDCTAGANQQFLVLGFA